MAFPSATFFHSFGFPFQPEPLTFPRVAVILIVSALENLSWALGCLKFSPHLEVLSPLLSSACCCCNCPALLLPFAFYFPVFSALLWLGLYCLLFSCLFNLIWFWFLLVFMSRWPISGVSFQGIFVSGGGNIPFCLPRNSQIFETASVHTLSANQIPLIVLRRTARSYSTMKVEYYEIRRILK